MISSFHPTPRPVSQLVTPPYATRSEMADINEVATTLAGRIQENFEGVEG